MTDAAPPPLVEVADLTVRRDGALVLDRVSLAVAPASIHVLVGPNGAGKSTLVAALLGQVPFTGSIRLHLRGAGRIGYVPQGFGGDRTLPITVAEFLALARQRRPVCLGVGAAARTRIDALLDRVGLAGFARRRLGELSGGELRRVLIANALDPAPELLLCDEPAAGLDVASSARLDQLLCSLRDDDGAAVLLVSHDRAQARRVGDHVTLLAGRVVRSGPPDEVLRSAEAGALAPAEPA